MSCYSCGGNPKTFCSECLASKDTWIAPVDVLPDPFLGDYDHLYRTPDGNLYALSPDRAEWISVNGEGRSYKGGNGISIGDDGVINNTKPNRDQDLSIDGRTITITHGNSIELPPDKDTLYNDAELRQRIQTLENRTDNFVTGVNVGREGNKVKLTYTFRNSPTKEVEFEDKDTIALAYDDTPLKQRIQRLEDKPDKDTIYDDKPINERIAKLEHEDYKEIANSQYPYSTSNKNVNEDKLIIIRPYTLFRDESGNNYYGVESDGTAPVSDIGVSLLKFDCSYEVKHKDSTDSHIYTREDNRIIKLDINKRSIHNNYEYPLDDGLSIKFVYTTDWNNQGKCSIHIDAYLMYYEVVDFKLTQYMHKLSKGEIDSRKQVRIPLTVGGEEKGFISFKINAISFGMFAYGRTLSRRNPSPSNTYSRLDTVKELS